MYQDTCLVDGKHAMLNKSVVEHFSSLGFFLVEHEAFFDHFRFGKGYVDLVMKKQISRSKAEWIVGEAKSSIPDLGATVRQIKWYMRCFMESRKDLFVPGVTHNVRFPLIIAATEENYRLWRRFHESFEGIEILFIPIERSEESDSVLNWFEIDTAIFRARKKS